MAFEGKVILIMLPTEHWVPSSLPPAPPLEPIIPAQQEQVAVDGSQLHRDSPASSIQGQAGDDGVDGPLTSAMIGNF
jgi:hypothetical protein